MDKEKMLLLKQMKEVEHGYREYLMSNQQHLKFDFIYT